MQFSFLEFLFVSGFLFSAFNSIVLGCLSFLPGAFKIVSRSVAGNTNVWIYHHMPRMGRPVTVLAVHRGCMPVLMATHTGNIAVFTAARGKHVGGLLMAG